MKKETLKSRQVEVLTNQTVFNYKRIEPNNRPIDEAHVKELYNSFLMFGTAGATMIVLQTRAVTGKLERYVADGQHSGIAAERAKMPLTVVVVELLEDTLFNVTQYIAMLNNTSKGWSTKNYINAFVNNEITEYKIFAEKMKNDGLTITDMQHIFMVRPKDFKSGEMKFPDLKDSLDLLEAYRSIKEYMPKKAFTRRSLYKVMRLAKDYKRMAKAIAKAAHGLKSAEVGFSENEHEFYAHLVKIYQREFNIK